MTKKAFYISFSQEHWPQVAKRLAEQGLVTPVYWAGNGELKDAVRAQFPEAVFHERFSAVRGVAPAELVGLPLEPLDQALLERMSVHESVVLKMMERMDIGDSFTYGERVSLYHTQLRYWLSVLRHFAPDWVLFFSSPHFVYDYVLYALCQQLGVRTMLFKGTSLPGWSYAAAALETESETLAACYRTLLKERSHTASSPALSPETQQYLQRLRGEYRDAQPAYMKKQLQRDSGSISAKQAANLKRYIEYGAQARDFALRAVRALRTRKAAHTLVKQRGKPVESAPSVLTYHLMKRGSRRKQKVFKSYYESRAVNVDLTQPYVFCALHLQPERTTSPDGGVFVHQHLMIDLLAKSLPEGWLLYVKEHASQFVTDAMFDSSSAQSRSFAFYNEIAALPNVRFVPLSHSPFHLIDHAEAVATVTGTVGWEAAVRGKPVLAFGYPWYRGCEGVFHTPTKESLGAALAQIRSGYEVEPDSVRRFAVAVERVGFQTYNYETKRREETLSDAELIERCTQALKNFLSDAPHQATSHQGGATEVTL